MSRKFSKPSLTLAQQIAHLRAAGMTVADDARAEHWLAHVSYYRLSGYWLPFELPKGPGGVRFRPGTDFDLITDLYGFDRDLRRIVMRGAEHIEVALRGSWAYRLAHSGGSHGYLDAGLYTDRKEFHANLAKLAGEVGASAETYIRHYRETYDDPALPAVWMVAEMMSFGQLSRWYSNLADRSLRNAIAQPLGLPEAVLVPFIKHLTSVRNICAHHGRLWNRGFRQPPMLARKPADLRATLDMGATQAPARLYNTLTMLVHLLRHVAPSSTWRDDLKSLLLTHPTGDLAAMGFPTDWPQLSLWR